jgi:hypothetical protein
MTDGSSDSASSSGVAPEGSSSVVSAGCHARRSGGIQGEPSSSTLVTRRAPGGPSGRVKTYSQRRPRARPGAALRPIERGNLASIQPDREGRDGSSRLG